MKFLLDTKITMFNSVSSLELSLVLGDDISTKITFDGENLKEKAVDENIASYK